MSKKEDVGRGKRDREKLGTRQTDLWWGIRFQKESSKPPVEDQFTTHYFSMSQTSLGNSGTKRSCQGPGLNSGGPCSSLYVLEAGVGVGPT